MFRQTLRKAIASVSTTALLLSSIIVPGMGVNVAQAQLDVNEQAIVDFISDATGMNTASGSLTRYDAAGILAGLDGCTDAPDSGLGDVDPQYGPWVNCVVDAGYFNGTADGNFEGDRTIHRDEFAAVTNRYAGNPDLTSDSEIDSVLAVYGDADQIDPGLRGAVASATNSGLYVGITDSNGQRIVNPGADILARHAAGAITKAVLYFWGGYTASEIQAMTGSELAAEAYVALGVEMGGNNGGETGNNGSTSEAGLSVSVGTYSDSTVPSGATSVPFLDINFTAGPEGSVTVQSLVLSRIGVSAVPGNLEGYLYDGDSRATTGRTINSTTDEMRFNNINIVVAAGTTKTITLRVDIGTVVATGEMGFEIESADAIVSNAAQVNGSFPLTGVKKDLSTTAAGSLTVTKTGTVATPTVGQKDFTAAKFRLTAGSTEDVDVHRIGVYFGGGSLGSNEIENVRLMIDGNVVAQTAGLNNQDVAVLVLDEVMTIGKGNNKQATIVIDLNTGQGGDTIQVYIEETTDILAIGDKFEYGVTINIAGTYDGTDCGGANTTCTLSTLQGGDITLTSNGPAAGDIATNAEDVVALKGTFAAKEGGQTVRKFAVSLTMSETGGANSGLLNAANGTPNLTDVKLVKVNEDGSHTVLGGPVDANVFTTTLGGTTVIGEGTDAATAFYVFQDEFTLDAGSFDYAITFDVENNTALNNDTVVARIEITTAFPEIRDVNNKTVSNATSLVPGSDIVGKTQTFKSSQVTFSIAATPVNGDTYVKGSNATFVCFIATNSEGQAVVITDMTVTGFIDDTGGVTFVQGQDTNNNNVFVKDIVGSVSLADADGNVYPGGDSETVQSSGNAVFDNVSIEIESGGSVTICVNGPVSTDAFKNSNNERIAFGITTATVESRTDGNAVGTVNTPNGTAGTIATSQIITDSGSLTFSVAPSTPKENIDVAGAANVHVSTIRATSTDEEFIVNDLDVAVRSDGILDADLAEYDDNVVTVKLVYTNSAGNEVTRTGFLDGGVAHFADLDWVVPKDDDSEVKILVDYNRVQDGADAGDMPEFNIALQELDVTTTGGETFSAASLDSAIPAGSGLSIGNVTFTDSTADVDGAVVVGAVGSALTITYDNGAGADSGVLFPEGTIVCISAATTCTTATDIRAVVTAYTDGATEDTISAILIDDADGTAADNENVLFAQPAGNYLTGTHDRHIAETKPTVSVSTASPSGGRTVNVTDSAFIFNVAAHAEEDVELRQAMQLGEAAGTLCVAGTGTTLTTATSATNSLTALGNGTTCETTAMAGAGDSALFPTGGLDLSQYQYVSFWLAINTASGANTIKPTDFAIATADANDGVEDQQTAITAANVANDNDTDAGLDDDVIYLFRDIAIPAGTDSLDTFIGLVNTGANVLDADDLYIDGFTLYNEKWELTLNSDSSLVTSNAATGDLVTIKEDGTPVGQAFVAQAGLSRAVIAFFPVSQSIEVTKGSSNAYTFEVDTSSLILDQSGIDDFLSASVNLGTSSAGVVTPGGFWWFDSNRTFQWVGNVPVINLTTPTLFY